MDIAAIGATAAAVRETQRRIGTIIADQPDDWRRALVRERRCLADDIVRLSASLEAAIPPPHAVAALAALRAAMSRMRTLLAHHQASWPAVSLEPDSELYRESVIPVREANGALQERFAALSRAAATGSGDQI